MMEKFQSMGGSELTYSKLISKLDPKYFAGINLILNSAHESFLKKNCVNIVWNQHNFDQPAISNMASQDYIKRVDYFIYVSHWQFEKYRYTFGIPEHKSLVIQNAVDEFSANVKPKKIKLIYTSTPWRGLEILLECFRLLDRDDVELDVFSSTSIYGTDFDKTNGPIYAELFDKAKNMKNVNYRGFASNEDVRIALQNAHIFSYPCIWEETSCMSAIEAGMAGLNLVTTNLGALYETCGSWARFVGYDPNNSNLITKYTHALNKTINQFWEEENQAKLSEQSKYFNQFYGWNGRIKEWVNFLSQVNKK
jgi:glycosyltransferase involved in cell wall biosynthesis